MRSFYLFLRLGYQPSKKRYQYPMLFVSLNRRKLRNLNLGFAKSMRSFFFSIKIFLLSFFFKRYKKHRKQLLSFILYAKLLFFIFFPSHRIRARIFYLLSFVSERIPTFEEKIPVSYAFCIS